MPGTYTIGTGFEGIRLFRCHMILYYFARPGRPWMLFARQDAGRSIEEVALACPGCEHLEERFMVHLDAISSSASSGRRCLQFSWPSLDWCPTAFAFRECEVLSECSTCTSFMILGSSLAQSYQWTVSDFSLPARSASTFLCTFDACRMCKLRLRWHERWMPGCRLLPEEVERESGTLWETDILRSASVGICIRICHKLQFFFLPLSYSL